MFEQPAVQRLIARARKQSFRPRQLIARGRSNEIGLLLEGSASLILEHECGEQAVLGYLHPGDFFGERNLCADRGSGGLTVRARASAVVAVVDVPAYHRIVMEEPALALVLGEQLALRLDRGYRQIGDHFFLDVTARLRRLLERLATEPDAQVQDDGTAVHINRLELAAMLGCSREMIARGLRTLEAAGDIRADGHIAILPLRQDAG